MTQEFVTLPREVVERSLKILNRINTADDDRNFLTEDEAVCTVMSIDELDAALRAALEQQPTTEKSLAVEKQLVGVVGWRNHIPNSVTVVHWTGLIPPVGTELYIGQQPQGEQEPVAFMHDVVASDGEPDQALSFWKDNFPLEGLGGFRSVGFRPLYTHPQPKTEPLTDEGIKDIHGAIKWHEFGSGLAFARAIEAAHNIK